MVDFSKMILNDRQSRKVEHFEGTFLDYLHILYEHPELYKLAHKRIYDLIVDQGVEFVKTEENPRLRRIYGKDTLKRYHFFKDNFFGIDKTLMKIVRYLHSAAMQGEEARQVLYLVGPVGAGKSSLIDSIKNLVESSEPIYALEGCPMREEPLHLIPKHSRKAFEDILGVKIEGDLCPVCRYRLIHEFKGEYERFPVSQTDYSIRSRKGIGVVPPVDPNNQDTSVLVGSVDISKMDLYPEDDPRVLSLNGAFNVGNRGLVEFIEVFKNDVEYLHTMITATQEKNIPSPGKGAMIYFDGVILAHSNEAEWNKFKSDHTNEAILTRLGPSAKVDPMTKLKIYNGEEIIEKGTTKRIDIMELKDEAEREGMSGISTRFISKALDTALSESEYDCINPIGLMEVLLKEIKEMAVSDELKKRYLGFLQDTIKKEYHKMLEKEVTKAFIHGYKEQAQDLFNNYLDHAEAYVNKTKLKDSSTGEELTPDEVFMRSIEEQIGVTQSGAKGFRQDVTAYMFSVIRNGTSVDYTSYEPLKEAIEKKLTASVRELSRIITKSKVRDKEQNEKYDAMVEEMKNNGYCDHCCNVILKYAANNLWKD